MSEQESSDQDVLFDDLQEWETTPIQVQKGEKSEQEKPVKERPVKEIPFRVSTKAPLRFVNSNFTQAILNKKEETGVVFKEIVKKRALLVQKAIPKNLRHLVGNKKQINMIRNWLENWKNQKYKACILSGPPGVGKTTAAQIIAKGYQYNPITLNASDNRSKQFIEQSIKDSCFNTSIQRGGKSGKTLWIMDEVDGISSGDKGGVSSIINLIKTTMVPIICICNDRMSKKIKSLREACLEIRFYPPSENDIAGLLFDIVQKESINAPNQVIKKVAQIAKGDVRQALNLLDLYLIAPNADFEQVQSKDKFIGCNSFDAGVALLQQSLKYEDKLNYFFVDYEFVPLMIQENYLQLDQDLETMSEAADSIAMGDILSRKIKTNQDYTLLTDYGVLSTLIPSQKSRQNLQISFPEILGKISSIGKKQRQIDLLRDRIGHISYNCDRLALQEYLNLLNQWISQPLNQDEPDIQEAVKRLAQYRLKPTDFAEFIDDNTRSNLTKVFKGVSRGIKSKLTKEYNKTYSKTG